MPTKLTDALLLIFCICIVAGCTTGYSSLRPNNDNSYELILADEQTILDAALEAIHNIFPDTAISNLAGKEKGYTFYTQPLLDRTTYQFIISKASGVAPDGRPVKGYFYSVRSHGTQFFVEQRYVEPLKSEFERLIARKGVTLIRTPTISFEQ